MKTRINMVFSVDAAARSGRPLLGSTWLNLTDFSMASLNLDEATAVLKHADGVIKGAVQPAFEPAMIPHSYDTEKLESYDLVRLLAAELTPLTEQRFAEAEKEIAMIAAGRDPGVARVIGVWFDGVLVLPRRRCGERPDLIERLNKKIETDLRIKPGQYCMTIIDSDGITLMDIAGHGTADELADRLREAHIEKLESMIGEEVLSMSPAGDMSLAYSDPFPLLVDSFSVRANPNAAAMNLLDEVTSELELHQQLHQPVLARGEATSTMRLSIHAGVVRYSADGVHSSGVLVEFRAWTPTSTSVRCLFLPSER